MATPQVERRGWLAAVGAALTGGCVGSRRPERVRVLAAGSLARTIGRHVRPAFETATGHRVAAEYRGTAALLRMVDEGVRTPDVVVGADATLVRRRLYGSRTDWDVVFAGNALGVGYDPASDLGDRLATAEPWHRVLLNASRGDLAIGDPDVDPLGYRALLAFELAARRHGPPDLRARLSGPATEVGDEPRLLMGVESGARPAAVVYRNMAVDHELPFRSFPSAYSFADPSLAEYYAGVSYTLPDGTVVRGRPIQYNATVLGDADAPAVGRAFVRFLLDRPALLDQAGLVVDGSFPQVHGSPPATVEATAFNGAAGRGES